MQEARGEADVLDEAGGVKACVTRYPKVLCTTQLVMAQLHGYEKQLCVRQRLSALEGPWSDHEPGLHLVTSLAENSVALR